MKIVEITRLEESKHGTIGVIRVNKVILGFTLEPPDQFNSRNISSIPAQQYRCVPYHSEVHGKTHIVTDVPGRSGILFHPGNVVGHTAGCILIGSEVGKLKGDRAILNSGQTFKRFIEAVGVGEEFHLTIREGY